MKNYLSLIGIIGMGLLLGGCAQSDISPEIVMERFSQSLAQLESFHYRSDLELSGTLPPILGEEVDQANFKVSGVVHSENLAMPSLTADVRTQALSPKGDIDLSGQLISLNDYTYFQVTNVILPNIVPLSLGLDSKWYKIKHPTGESADSQLGIDATLELSGDEIDEVKELLVAYPLFTINDILPEETVVGQRSYHYVAHVNQGNAAYLASRLGIIMGLSDQIDWEILSQYELNIWISKRDFNITRLQVADIYLLDNLPVSFNLDMVFTQHNSALPINVPNVSEEINDSLPIFSAGI